MISYMVSRLVIQLFATLYPAYSSYKTVRTKNVKGYVQWMKYWIVFAFLSSIEPFCDFFLSPWLPFYYESKILIVVWLLCPATRGYNYLYRALVHPTLMDNEEFIDDLLNNVKEQWRTAVFEVGKRGSTIMMQTMLKGVLSRTGSTLGAYFQRPNSFTDPTFGYGEIDERAIGYHHQHALIRTLFLSDNRRNSDPNFLRHRLLQDSYREKPSDMRCVHLRRNMGITNFETVRYDTMLDKMPILSKNINTGNTPGDESMGSCPTSEENLSIALEDYLDDRILSLPPAVNQGLASLARKLSLEGLTDKHIGTVVSTLISDLEPDVSFSSENETPPKNDTSETSLDISLPSLSEVENTSQFEEQSHHNISKKEDNQNKSEGELEGTPSTSSLGDSKNSRAGRYRKLPAPSPPDCKKNQL